jgi:hypothetical protein
MEAVLPFAGGTLDDTEKREDGEILYKVAKRFVKRELYGELIRLIKRHGCPEGVRDLIRWQARKLAFNGDRTAFRLLEACGDVEPDALRDYFRKTEDLTGTLESIHLAGEEAMRIMREVFQKTEDPLRFLPLCTLPRENHYRELCRLVLLRAAMLRKDKRGMLISCRALTRPTMMKILRGIGRDIKTCGEAVERLLEMNREALYWNDCVELALRGELTKALSLAGNSERLLAEIIKDYFLSGFIRRPRELFRAVKMEEFKRGAGYFLRAFARRELKPEPIYLFYRW